MPNVLETAKRLSPKSWAMIGGAAAAAIVFLVILMQIASKPSYSTLETGIDPSQTGKITSTLSTQGIPYQLQNGGTALAVESSKVSAARVALAGAGLLNNSQPGFSLLDKQSLGQSNFQQQVTYERALEGQLDSTIESIDGVSSAQVNLTLPNTQDELFSDQNQTATASVLLSGSSNLQQGSVRGIAQLVASSVPSLSLNKVTITGDDGTLLWPNAGSGSGSGGLPGKEASEQRYDAAENTQLDALLASTLGAGKATVMVNANLNTNQATSDSLVYGSKKTAVPSSVQSSSETLKGGGSSAGSSGTSSNIPAYSTGSSSSGGNSNYKNTTSNTNYDVDKTVTHSVIAPGQIQNQSVAVLVDKSVPAAEIPAIKTAVANAVGLNAKRGDTMSISQLQFAANKTTAATAAKVNPIEKYGKYGALGLASLVFLGLAGRMLKKREKASFGEPTWLTELEAPRSLAALEASAQPTEVAALQPHVGVARRQVEDLVSRDPDRVAQHVRAWMAED